MKSSSPTLSPQTAEYPMRINRYLAQKGQATRRGADDLIRAGRIRINGRKAVIGERVSETDTVEVLTSHAQRGEFRYVAYYKPRGVITHSPQGNERSIDAVSGFAGLSPMGRLDKESEGLIILTNDGRVTERLLHPRFSHEKEYIVTVREPVTDRAMMLLRAGVESDGERLEAKSVMRSNGTTLTIVLTEGKKHHIRRMLDVAHLTVTSLKRVRIMHIHLGALKPGEGRVLVGPAKKSFLRDMGLEAL